MQKTAHTAEKEQIQTEYHNVKLEGTRICKAEGRETQTLLYALPEPHSGAELYADDGSGCKPLSAASRVLLWEMMGNNSTGACLGVIPASDDSAEEERWSSEGQGWGRNV